MSENKENGFVEHTRRVSTGDYEHIEQTVRLPVNEDQDPKDRLLQAADIADKEAERRSRKLILPESKEKGGTWMEREAMNSNE